MKAPRANLALALSLSLPALGQALPAPAAAPVAATPASAPAAPAYVDRVIEGLPPQDDAEGDSPPYDPSGWPRYLRVEARAGTQPFDTRHRTRAGLAAQGLLETPNHGVLSLDTNTLAHNGDTSLTLRQRELPLPEGWRGQHELGVVDRPAPSITRLPSRIYVPSSVMLGATGQWDQAEQGWQVLAAHGEAGQLLSGPVTQFERLGGQRSLLGLQASRSPSGGSDLPRGWSGALMLENAANVRPTGTSSSTPSINASAVQTVLRHDEGDTHLQGHFVQNQGARQASGSNLGGERQGAWVDAEWTEGPRRHNAGAYRLDTGLGWVDQALPEDLQGLYYRGLWRNRLWSVEGSLDSLHNLSGQHGDGFYATSQVRWRLSRDHSLSAGLTLRRYAGQGSQAFGDWRWQNDWGGTGLRLDATDTQDNPRSQSLTWDQDWRLPLGYTLASSLTHSRESAWPAGGLDAQQLWRAALAGSVPVGAFANLRGNLSTEQSSLGNRSWGANLGASWRLAPQWQLEAQYTRALGRVANSASLDPLAPRPTALSTASRTALLVLRYEFQAGSRSLPLGGNGQQGGGRVQGIVYFDANRSGTQEASETGVPSVLVVLDNRYVVRTDAQGRFEFPLVAAGAHTVAVRNDSLPLPWSTVDDGAPQRIEVQLRGESTLAIAVQRAQ